jgi:hypothetical protein
MTGRLLITTLALVLGVASSTAAQTYEHLAIIIEGRTIEAVGGERANTSMSSGALVIGKTTSAAFTKLPDMCGFSVAQRLRPGGISGWTVSVTPTKVEDDAVTFQVQWVRAIDEGRATTQPSGQMEVTLRPGESMPLDTVPLSPDVTMPYERCHVRATSLRVGVDYWPRPDRDRRLVGTELWLVQRLADGSERGQSVSLRGLPFRDTPFFFDTITDAGVDFDLFGDIGVALDTNHPDELVVTIHARGRVTESGRSSTSVPSSAAIPSSAPIPSGVLIGSRSVESSIRLRAGEIVDVALPRLTENASGAFADRTLSLRIRAGRIR